MTESPVGARGDQPPADAGLTAKDLADDEHAPLLDGGPAPAGVYHPRPLQRGGAEQSFGAPL